MYAILIPQTGWYDFLYRPRFFNSEMYGVLFTEDGKRGADFRINYYSLTDVAGIFTWLSATIGCCGA